MDRFFITMVTILFALCPAGSEVLTVTGVVGGRVVIKCSFNSLDNHIKYFCKSPCLTESDVIIKTKVSNNYIAKGRYSITDHGNGYFTVTIKDLKKSDSGTYWCVVERVGVDSYQMVNLSVVEAPPTTSDVITATAPMTGNQCSHSCSKDETAWEARTTATPPEAVNSPNIPGTPVVIMVCVGLAVLVLGLLLICKWRRVRKASRPLVKPDTSTQDSRTNQSFTLVSRDSTYQTLTKGTQDSTYQTLTKGTQDSTYQTLTKETQDSTYQTLSTSTQDSTYQTLTKENPRLLLPNPDHVNPRLHLPNHHQGNPRLHLPNHHQGNPRLHLPNHHQGNPRLLLPNPDHVNPRLHLPNPHQGNPRLRLLNPLHINPRFHLPNPYHSHTYKTHPQPN
uniref:Immunoglobulin domain-containing protein n=1 Tax=Esox lucius TaxID=8010 RepID=A0AAY5JYR4_ESOLU